MCRCTNSFVGEGQIQAQRGDGSATVMARLALKRRAKFRSRTAAMDSFAAKPPFRSFRRDVLQAYLQHGLRDLPGTG
jgi:hypothetical protein